MLIEQVKDSIEEMKIKNYLEAVDFVDNREVQALILPQVAIETSWSLEEFLEHLCVDKAGLSSDCYKDSLTTELYIFTAQVFD